MEQLCYVVMGSNDQPQWSIERACRLLAATFPDITFAQAEETVPIGLRNPAMFINQVGRFCTSMTKEEVVKRLKTIEQEIGRRPEDKVLERVCIDIDLLTYGDRVLKPKDCKRDYVARGLKELTKQ